MAKFFGTIGYITTTETEPGIWKKVVVRKQYAGDLINVHKRWQNSGEINDDIDISAEVSIIADPYFKDHMHEIRFVTINDVPWKVSSIEPNHPRYILSIGGLYNGGDA